MRAPFSASHRRATRATARPCRFIALLHRALTRDPPATPLPLFPRWGMCYNRRAVQRAAKAGATPVQPEPGDVIPKHAAPAREDAEATAMDASGFSIAVHEDVSRYCPVCSQRLESRRCKLICLVCGYYMSCADYY
jgi:hypothetical protein